MIRIERPDDDVRGHHRVRLAGDGRKRRKIARAQRRLVDLDRRQRVVRIDGGGTVTRKMLVRGEDAAAFEAAREGPRHARDGGGIGAEGTVADHGVSRIDREIEHRREVEIAAGAATAAAACAGFKVRVNATRLMESCASWSSATRRCASI